MGDRLKTYLKIIFSSEGDSPRTINKRVEKIGFRPVIGDYDYVIETGFEDNLFDILEKLHNALKGSKARYTVISKE